MKRILIIDDDPDIRSILTHLLTSDDVEILQAANGEEGTRTLASAVIDLVITDIVMPEKEGLAVIMELRERNPKPKIIAISGQAKIQSSSDYLKYAGALGADKVLLKPLDLAAVLQAVRELLA